MISHLNLFFWLCTLVEEQKVVVVLTLMVVLTPINIDLSSAGLAGAVTRARSEGIQWDVQFEPLSLQFWTILLLLLLLVFDHTQLKLPYVSKLLRSVRTSLRNKG